MRLIRTPFGAALVLVAAFSFASGQAEKVERAAQDSSLDKSIAQAGGPAETNKANAPSVQNEPQIWIHLVGGRRMQVDEVIESADGIWFKRSNVSTFLDRGRVERIERISSTKVGSSPETLHGSGNWTISDSARVEDFFLAKFGRRLPLTAFGQSDLHTRWGFDHRQGMDVGLHPDSQEGRGLIEFLRSEEIPFLAFREAVPGVATGPHIHVGNRSRRVPAR
jgi:hypothetical protein